MTTDSQLPTAPQQTQSRLEIPAVDNIGGLNLGMAVLSTELGGGRRLSRGRVIRVSPTESTWNFKKIFVPRDFFFGDEELRS